MSADKESKWYDYGLAAAIAALGLEGCTTLPPAAVYGTTPISQANVVPSNLMHSPQKTSDGRIIVTGYSPSQGSFESTTRMAIANALRTLSGEAKGWATTTGPGGYEINPRESCNMQIQLLRIWEDKEGLAGHRGAVFIELAGKPR